VEKTTIIQLLYQPGENLFMNVYNCFVEFGSGHDAFNLKPFYVGNAIPTRANVLNYLITTLNQSSNNIPTIGFGYDYVITQLNNPEHIVASQENGVNSPTIIYIFESNESQAPVNLFNLKIKARKSVLTLIGLYGILNVTSKL